MSNKLKSEQQVQSHIARAVIAASVEAFRKPLVQEMRPNQDEHATELGMGSTHPFSCYRGPGGEHAL